MLYIIASASHRSHRRGVMLAERENTNMSTRSLLLNASASPRHAEISVANVPHIIHIGSKDLLVIKFNITMLCRNCAEDQE